MKENKSTKVENQKKDKKDKIDKKAKKEKKEKEDKKEDKKEVKKETKVQEPETEEDYYTPEEIILLDKFHEFSGKKFEDDEIYEVMLKFNNDEELIKNELKEMLKVLKRGDEYSWTEIGKSN